MAAGAGLGRGTAAAALSWESMKYFMGPRIWENTAAAIDAAGFERVDDITQADAYIHTSHRPDVPELPDNIRFVQYCYTGVNHLIDAGVIGDIPWTNTAGAFASPVAESALGLLLSQAHHHKRFALEASWAGAKELDKTQAWLYTRPLAEPKEVAIFGAGGIGKRLIELLQPFGVRITAVNNSGRAVPGADETIAMADADPVWGRADFIVLILPLTPQTRGLVDAKKFAQMKKSAILVNVGRGATVVTDDLVAALESGEIAGAGLEVMDPEPLPDGHPLYSLPNATLTPHIAASFGVAQWHVAEVFIDNARALERGEDLPTRIDPSRGY